MLQVQVNLAANREQARHNLITEQQTNVDLQRKRDELNEVIRHNKENEAVAWGTLAETTRSNKAQEALGWANYNINSARLVIDRMNANSNARNASSNEWNAITNRINAATNRQRMLNDYSLGIKNLAVSQANANTNRLNAQIAAMRLDVDTYRAKTDRMNARTNQMNADSNRITAQSKAMDSATKYHTFEWNASQDIINNVFKGFTTFSKVPSSSGSSGLTGTEGFKYLN